MIQFWNLTAFKSSVQVGDIFEGGYNCLGLFENRKFRHIRKIDTFKIRLGKTTIAISNIFVITCKILKMWKVGGWMGEVDQRGNLEGRDSYKKVSLRIFDNITTINTTILRYIEHYTTGREQYPIA